MHPDHLSTYAIESLRAIIAPAIFDQLLQGTPLPAAVLAETAQRLNAEVTAIASYVPPSVAREQRDDPVPGKVRGAFWRGSLLFADLSGFTALSGQLSALGKQGAEEISAIINALFAALIEELDAHHGELLKFGGDALTAFFHEAALGPAHAALAAGAALTMQRRMQAFAALQTPAGVHQLRLRVGVHSGQVFAAQVGDAGHVELVVTGGDISRVAQAQDVAEPGETVISAEARALVAGADTIERREGFFLLRGLPLALPPAPAPAAAHAFADAPPTTAHVLALAEQIAALRPFLPYRLPRRFLTSGDIGEFRPVTTLFANVAPFSRFLGLLGADAATAARVLNAYYRRAQDVVHRYGGIVNKMDMYTHGDKFMALFGAPLANEDDPKRAVLAALEMREALDAANAEIADLLPAAQFQLAQRIGINTGVVFAGQVGLARRREYTVMGQPVNLAARLMSAAPGDAVVLSATTRRAVEGQVALRELPAVPLKGVAEPTPIFQALRPLSVAQEPARRLERAALVGRAAELERLLAEARAALHGTGRVIALIGEAGAGKTRLIEEALNRLVHLSADPTAGVPPFMIYSAECQSYEQTTPYAVTGALLRDMLGLAHDARPDEAARRLARAIPDMARFAPLVGDLLGSPVEDTPLTAALTPEQRHDRAQELIEALLAAETRRQPLIVVMDDIQWADASSLDVVLRLARAAPRQAFLLMLGYRPDGALREPWRELEHCSALGINELPHDASALLVRELLGAEPPAALASLVERAQGNPFFVEELIRELIERGALLHTENGWRLAGDLDESALPGSVEGLIIARLDHLNEPSREIAQLAAVIGRRFSHSVLAGAAAADVGGALRDLAAADLVLPESDAERDTARLAYLFKHALTRDVAYGAILYARRRELHRHVAEQIERLYQDRIDEQVSLLARHWLLAEHWQRAFGYHLRAGRQAQQRYANRETIIFLEGALEIGARLTPRPPEDTLIELYERLGVVRALIGEYDEALARYQQALERRRVQPSAPLDDLIRLHHHIARVFEKRAEFETAFDWVERALALANDTPGAEAARCLLLGAGLHQRQGRYQQALAWGERALAVAEDIGQAREQTHALRLLGGTYRNLGDNARALELLIRSLALAEAAQDLGGRGDTHNDLANVCYDLGRLAEAQLHYEAGARIKEQIGDVYGQAMIANNLGDLLKLQGRLDEAAAQFEHSLAIFERLGSRYAAGVLHMNLGAVQLARRDLARAAEHLTMSGALFTQVGAEDFLPELERYLAELALARADLAAARAAYEQALATAIRLEARVEEAMTRRAFARALATAGEVAAAGTQLHLSLTLLREAGSAHELARTLVAFADLAPALGRVADGQTALDEALPALLSAGAAADLEETRAIAARHGYRMTV